MPRAAVDLVADLEGDPRAVAHSRASATPLLSRPYDLRHSGVTWRLNSGVPPTEVAAWAGHSVEVLMRTYARCVAGMEDVWISRMNQALRLEDPDQPGVVRHSS